MLNLNFKEKNIFVRLKNEKAPIILYGMGNGADKVISYLNKFEIPIYGIMASDDFCRYQTYKDFKVKKLSDFEKELNDFIILLCFGTDIEYVINHILEISKKHTLLVPSISLFGNEIVNDDFINENLNKIKEAYNLLSDEYSKTIYEKSFHFLYTGELKYLQNMDSNKKEIYKLLELNNSENYLDLGAYDGDTIKDFICYTNGYKKITAVEPNIKNFTKLLKNSEELNNIELINKGISNICEKTYISKNAGRMAHISDENGVEIETTTVDELFKASTFSYIKCDVEGYETKMIEGAKSTLLSKPKLSISAYHKPSDIFNLILQINSINPEYKFYLRKQKYIPLWDLNIYAK